MQLAASTSDLLASLTLPTISQLKSGISPSLFSSTPSTVKTVPQSSGFSFNNLLSTIGNIGTAGLQVYGAINQAKYLSSVGINPVGYQNGLPVYGSTPSGVTPTNPFSLPSGSYLPPGVTPSGGYPYAGQSFITSQGNSITDFLTSKTGMYIMIGGSALMLMLYTMKSKGT